MSTSQAFAHTASCPLSVMKHLKRPNHLRRRGLFVSFLHSPPTLKQEDHSVPLLCLWQQGDTSNEELQTKNRAEFFLKPGCPYWASLHAGAWAPSFPPQPRPG